MNPPLTYTDSGLYCPAGDFFIDPIRPVKRAVVTHAHADHARPGCESYLACAVGKPLLRMRLGSESDFHFLDYGETINLGGVNLSLHPAGHMLGSAQVRLEHKGYVAVITGDYKLGHEPTCQSWSPVECNLLITESTFGLPVFRWPPEETVVRQINDWWRDNQAKEICSVLYGYAIGKSQRVLAALDDGIGSIFTHGAIEKGVQAYRDSGVALPDTKHVASAESKQDFRGALVLAVPSAHGTTWMKRFGQVSTAMVSGWTMIRGWRRRRFMDHGFVISDHVDWPALMRAIRLCDPEEVWVDHGYSDIVARYLNHTGRKARAVDSKMSRIEEDQPDSSPTASEAYQ